MSTHPYPHNLFFKRSVPVTADGDGVREGDRGEGRVDRAVATGPVCRFQPDHWPGHQAQGAARAS